MPEIKKSDSEAEECVRRMLREYNSAFMNESRDYSFHIEEDGQIAAGIVAESVADTVEVSFLCVRKDLRGSGHGKALPGGVIGLAGGKARLFGPLKQPLVKLVLLHLSALPR